MKRKSMRSNISWIKFVCALVFTLGVCMLIGRGWHVSANAATTDSERPMRVHAKEGIKSTNRGFEHYQTCAQPIESYLITNDKGGVTRIELISNALVIEEYDASYNLSSQKKLVFSEQAVFGGFYQGELYNYVMLGNENADAEQGIPEYELLLYNDAFEKVDSYEVSGINSNMSLPFGSTGVNFEESGGYLYVRTGHVMRYGDWAGHQENLYFIFDLVNKSVFYYDDEYRDTPYGDVGHTLNRYMKMGDDYLYVAEQQDSGPNGIFLFALPTYQYSKEKVAYTTAAEFEYIGGMVTDNNGSMGGMELSDEAALIVGSYKNYGNDEWERNIFLSVTSTETSSLSSRVIYLTDHQVGSRVMATTPHIVKVDNDRFCVLWTEYDIPNTEGQVYFDDCEWKTCYVFIDGRGNVISDTIEIEARLSDCKPIVQGNYIVWYYTEDYREPLFIHIPTDGSVPVWNPTGYDYYPVSITYPDGVEENSYAYGSNVLIVPQIIAGKEFVKWEAESDNITISVSAGGTLSFIMPAEEVKIKAIYKEAEEENQTEEAEKQTKYKVTFHSVLKESGAGEYLPGETVTIRAAESTAKIKFVKWTSDSEGGVVFADPRVQETTFIMPAKDVIIRPIYNCAYEVKVDDGSGDGYYFEGDIVTIEADDISGYDFYMWEFSDKNGSFSIANPVNVCSKKTTFEMVSEEVHIKALYKETEVPKVGDEVIHYEEAAMPEVGDEVTHSSGKYIITDVGSEASVSFMGVKMQKTSLTIPSEVTIKGKKYKVTSIASGAFENNKKLETLVIGSDVKKIGDSAFKGCTKLKKVTIGASVNSIGKNAFSGCTKLETVTFKGDSKLETIGKSAFASCKLLTKIIIPKKVKKIDSKAFYNCNKLKKITIKSTKLKTVGKNALKGVNVKCKIKVPSKKYKAYEKLFKGKGQKKTVKVKM